MSSRSVASAAAARISSCTCTLSAFIFGRSSRIVPTPSATSSRTNSPDRAPSRSAIVSLHSLSVCGCAGSPAGPVGQVRGTPSGIVPSSGTMARVTPGMWSHLGQTAKVWPGRNYPLGATWSAESTNFAVYAPAATQAWVCLFDDDGVETRHQLTERSLGIWHGAIPGVAPGTRYGYRVDGPWSPAEGLRFNPAQAAARPLRPGGVGGPDAGPGRVRLRSSGAPAEMNDEDSAPYVPRSVVVDDHFDWGGDAPMRRRWRDTVIYEMHVKGMTALHDRVPEELRGTYAGLATPAVTDYLRDLGVTAVELLPVHQFLSETWLAKLGPHQLLGLQLHRVLRTAQRLLRVGRPRRAGDRVQADGEGVPRRGSRGHPRRRLQPHRRGRRGRARRCRSAASTTAGSTSGSGRRPTRRAPPPPSTTPTGTSPAAATPSTPPTRSRCG